MKLCESRHSEVSSNDTNTFLEYTEVKYKSFYLVKRNLSMAIEMYSEN
jgi:hypothetical protein